MTGTIFKLRVSQVACQRAIACFPGCALLVGALTVPVSVSGANWTNSISGSLRQTYTDNSELTDSDKESEWTTSVTPGISVRGEGARLNLDFNYGLNLNYHSGNDRTTSANHRLQAQADSELADKWLFLDARAIYTQTLIEEFGRSGGDTTSNTGDTENTFAWEVSPNTRHSLGGYAKAATRLRYNEVRNTTSTDSRGVEAKAVVESGRYFPDLPWSLVYRYMKDFGYGSSGSSSRRHVLDAFVKHNFSRIWGVQAGAGREWNDFETTRSDSDGMRWTAAVTWTPSDRTFLRVGYSDRFYGSHPTLDFSHRSRRSVWTASYYKSLSNSRQLRLGNEVYQTEDAFGDRIVDPVTGDPQEVNSGLGDSNADIFVNQVFQTAYTLETRRTTLSVNIRRSEKQYQDSSRDTADTDVSMSMSRTLWGDTRATADFGWQRTDDNQNREESENREHDTWIAGLELSRSLGRRTRIGLNYRFRHRDSNAIDDDYTENRISARLSTSWQ